MNFFPCRILVVLSLGIFCIISAAAQAQSELADNDLLQRFPGTTVVSQASETSIVHQLALGILQRNAGIAVPEDTRRITGDLTKVLYEIPREYSGEDVYQYFRSQLNADSYRELFSCLGRACGSSNDWANDIFQNRILYGPAQNQYYMAYQQAGNTGLEPAVAVYIITRGNRRLYAYVEIIKPEADLVESRSGGRGFSLEQLLEAGFVALEGVSFTNDGVDESNQLTNLANELNRNPEVNVYIVSHLSSGETLGQQRQRSQARADSVLEYLVAQGVSASRLSAAGVGPLAPGCATELCRNRLEIVVQ